MTINTGASPRNEIVVKGHLDPKTAGIDKKIVSYSLKIKQTTHGEDLVLKNLKFKDKIMDFFKKLFGMKTDADKTKAYLLSNTKELLMQKIVGVLNKEGRKGDGNKLIIELSETYLENADDAKLNPAQDIHSNAGVAGRTSKDSQSRNQHGAMPFLNPKPTYTPLHTKGNDDKQTDSGRYTQSDAADQASAHGLTKPGEVHIDKVASLITDTSFTQEYDPNAKIKIANQRRQNEYDNDIAPKQKNFSKQEMTVGRAKIDVSPPDKWNSFLDSTKVRHYDRTDNIKYIQDPLEPSPDIQDVLLFGGKYTGDGVLGRTGREIKKNSTAQFCFKYPPVLQVIQKQGDDRRRPLKDTEILTVMAPDSGNSLYFMPAKSIIDSSKKHFTMKEVNHLFAEMLATFNMFGVAGQGTELHTGFLEEVANGKDPVVIQKLLRIAARTCGKKVAFHGEKACYDKAENELISLSKQLPDASLKQVLEGIYNQQPDLPAHSDIDTVSGVTMQKTEEIKRSNNLNVKVTNVPFVPEKRVFFQNRDGNLNSTKQDLYNASTYLYQQKIATKTVPVEICSLKMSHEQLTQSLKEQKAKPIDKQVRSEKGYLPEKHEGPNFVTAMYGNANIGGGVLGSGFVQEEIACLGSPEMLQVVSHFKEHRQRGKKDMSRTECMIVDDVTRNSLVSQRGGNHNYYGGQGLGQLEADLRKSGDQAKKMYPEDTLYKANVASIHATDYKGTYKSEYTVEELLDLTLQLKALFARLKEKHCKKPGDRVTFNTGIFGGGAYRNSHVVMQVIQMLAAQSEEEKDGRGINLVFYGSETQYTNHDKNAHEEAKAFFNEMVNNNVSQYAILKALSAQGRQGEKSWLYQHGDRG